MKKCEDDDNFEGEKEYEEEYEVRKFGKMQSKNVLKNENDNINEYNFLDFEEIEKC